MPLRKLKNSEKGQVLLIVVLASVISLTVGLAAVSRSITNTRVSTEESNSQKALAAAEAGVEEQLSKANTGTAIPYALSNNSNYTASAKSIDGTDFPLNNGDFISQDVGADIWLADHATFNSPTTTTLKIYWGTSSSGCNDAAIEIAVISGAKANPNMDRYTADACGNRISTNHFSGTNATPNTITDPNSGQTYYHGRSISVTSGYIVRVIPLYGDTKVYVNSSVALPAQGYLIESKGTSGNTVRKVKVYQGFPRIPVEFFPYNLFLP